MCKDCDALPLGTQELLAGLFAAGMDFLRSAEQGNLKKANHDMDHFLAQLLGSMPAEGIKALMGTLILMSMDELHPIFHHVRQHYAESN